nr:JmjC domain-containing protein [Tanacetum cinerariifolium]
GECIRLTEDFRVLPQNHRAKEDKLEVVCRTHRVSSAHHARSDGVPKSVPTVAPQGLAILLADVATQTKIIEDEASPRLIRSKSLPPLYDLDWP